MGPGLILYNDIRWMEVGGKDGERCVETWLRSWIRIRPIQRISEEG